MSKTDKVGARLRAARTGQDLSIQKLVDKIYENCGEMIDEKTIRRIENGEAVPNYNTLKKVIDGLAIDVEDLDDELKVLMPLMAVENNEETKEENLEIAKLKSDLYSVLFPKNRDKFRIDNDNTEDSYKSWFKYPIMTLFEFLIYLPLMNIRSVYDVLGRIWLGYNDTHDYVYVLEKLKYLYDSIPESEAKNAARNEIKKIQYETILNSTIHKAEDMDVIPPELKKDIHASDLVGDQNAVYEFDESGHNDYVKQIDKMMYAMAKCHLIETYEAVTDEEISIDRLLSLKSK